MSLLDYLESFHRAIGKFDEYGFAESLDIKEEIRSVKQAVVNAKIAMVDGSILHIRVFIDAKYKTEIISYAFQYQDDMGNLIFRYDNAHHKPELGFKDHKHLGDGSIIQSFMPDITHVVDEVIRYII